MNAVTKDLRLASGETVQVGMNFYALNLMMQYPGGFSNLQADTGDEEDAAKAMDAFIHIFWALIRAGGKVCTKEECAMAIGFEDFEALMSVLDEFTASSNKIMPKNAPGRARGK